MVSINIDNQEYKIPSEPTVKEWQALMKYDFNEFEQWTAIINELTGAPLAALNAMDYEQKKLAVVMIAHGIQQRQELPLPDFNELEFGAWIDIEYYLAMGLDKSITDVITRLGYSITLAKEALFVTEKYMAWRESIYKQYASLFSYDDAELDEMVETNRQSANEVAKGWYNILVDLAGDNVLNIERVTELKIKQALNFMATRKEKQIAEAKRNKQKQREHDLQRTRR